MKFVDRTQRFNHVFKQTKTVIDRTDPKFDSTIRLIHGSLAKTPATFVIDEYKAALETASIIIYEGTPDDQIDQIRSDDYVDEPIVDDSIELTAPDQESTDDATTTRLPNMRFSKAVVVSKADSADSHTVTNYFSTTPTCSCPLSLSMLLPCRHIFHVRIVNDVEPFSGTMVPPEWQLAHLDYSHVNNSAPSRQLLLPELNGYVN